MKKSVLVMSAILVAMNFVQFASPAALTALCCYFYEEENETSTLKVVVADNWKSAIVTRENADSVNAAVGLKCNGPKSMDEEFKCEVSFEISGIGRASMTFLRDTDNNIVLVAEGASFDEDGKEFDLDTQTFKCVAQ